jgi:endonuclease/exonuclease/phosphatase family metal-dependent hydrolase
VPPPFDGELLVVTYNIKEGQEVEAAGDALQTVAPLYEADVILLQEMDEAGVERLAQRLAMNYVYYPAFVSRDGRNVGNAILARWPLTDPQKILLPGASPLTGQKRIAVKANVDLGPLDFPVYSVHTETYTSQPSMRTTQVEAIADDIESSPGPAIVGGDFNTVSNRSIRRLTERFEAVGLERISTGLGSTIAKYGISPVAADHIFTRGFSLVASGKNEDLGASDHFPVWAKLAMDDEYWPPDTTE